MRTQRSLSYPAARTVDQIDEYHGVLIKDPYRWMENLGDAKLWARWMPDGESPRVLVRLRLR